MYKRQSKKTSVIATVFALTALNSTKNKQKLPLPVGFRAIVVHVPLISQSGTLPHDLPFRSAFVDSCISTAARPSPSPWFLLVAALGVICCVWRSQLFSASLPCHLVMKRSAPSATPRHHFPLFLASLGHNTASTPNSKGELSVDPSVAWKYPDVVC